jgi:hemolysin activation/secretion protein
MVMFGRLLATLALSTWFAATAAAQVVERHLPPAPASGSPRLDLPVPPPDLDNRPIGPRLTGIVLISADEAVTSTPVSGVRISNFAPPHPVTLARALTRQLGQPLSHKQISEVVAVVVRHYRRAGRPFVSVTTPEQELTGGVLSLRVIEFRAESLSVRAPSDATTRRVKFRVRFPAGKQIDARALQQDLTWLDRYPFRRAGAVFAAGVQPGTTDLTITVTPTRPWQVFAGISSSDAPSSGPARFYAGAVAGGLIGPDSVISAQATTSGFDDPRYLGIAARLSEPVGPRRELSLLTSYVRGQTTAVPFSSITRTAQASLDLRFALPPTLVGDGHLGIEAGHQWLDARFGGAPIYHVSATTLALFAGYSVSVPVHGGALSADVTLHVSPGGLGGGNDADRLFFGRSGGGSATYAYVTANVSLERPVFRAFVWQTGAILQASSVPLPGLDQIGLGGSGYVRGYTLDDGGYDAGIILRNALTLRRVAGFSPYLLTDWGIGRYVGRAGRDVFGSVGLGMNKALGHGLNVQVDAALPLLDGPRTKALTPRIFARLDFAL